MTDISKCSGVDSTTQQECPKRERCYRYTAPDSGRNQSWLAHAPFESNGHCVLFKFTWREQKERAS